MKVVFLNHQWLSILGTIISLEGYCMLLRLLDFFFSLKTTPRISLVVQWLEHRASTAGSTGSIPGGGTKILHAMRVAKKIK